MLGYKLEIRARFLKSIHLYDIVSLLNKEMFKGDIQHFGLLTLTLIIGDILHHYVKSTVHPSFKIKKT